MTCMRVRTISNFGQIRPRAAELLSLKDGTNWFLLNILRVHGQNLTKFCIHSYHWQDLYCYCKNVIFRKFATELQPLIDIRNWFLLNIFRMDGQNLTKFCIHFNIDKIYVCIVKGHFLQIYNRVTALDWCQKLFLLNIDRIINKFCIHIIMDKVYVVLVNCNFSQICNGVTALDWCQIFFFVQYFENEMDRI